MRFLDREPVRFILVGGLNTLTVYAAYLALLPVIGYVIAYSVSYVAGIFFAYLLSALFVFRRPLNWRHAIQYPLVYVVQYGLGMSLTTVLIECLHLREEYVPVLVIVAMLPFTFLIARRIIKRKANTVESR